MADLSFDELKNNYYQFYVELGKLSTEDKQLRHVQNDLVLRTMIKDMESVFPKDANSEDEYIMFHAYSSADGATLGVFEKSHWLKHTKAYLRKFIARPEPNNDMARLEFIARAAERAADSNEERFKIAKKATEKFLDLGIMPSDAKYNEYLSHKTATTKSKEKYGSAYLRDKLQEAENTIDVDKKDDLYKSAISLIEHIPEGSRLNAIHKIFPKRHALYDQVAVGKHMEINRDEQSSVKKIFKTMSPDRKSYIKQAMEKYR